ncbi:hypothetical protein MTR_4g049770 [Medicago truncatula]|uniref:Uncharacterized protein n=1 Tax=Medicago truncatula TaxID=3880 RepID=A0A072UUZ5_MEDTR|nr:hypothetical protein MTR_4g049770 [Medicago truncatula]
MAGRGKTLSSGAAKKETSRSCKAGLQFLVDECCMKMKMMKKSWGEYGKAWKWRRMLFAWEEDLVKECVDLLSSVVLKGEVLDAGYVKLEGSFFS